MQNFQPQHSTFVDVQQQQQQNHPQLSSIVYQTQELKDSQSVVAFLQNGNSSFSVVPLVTAVEIDNCPQYSNLTECSVDDIQQKTARVCASVSDQIIRETSRATIYLAHNPPAPTDFSHFVATTSATTNLELQSFVSVPEVLLFKTDTIYIILF